MLIYGINIIDLYLNLDAKTEFRFRQNLFDYYILSLRSIDNKNKFQCKPFCRFVIIVFDFFFFLKKTFMWS